jgi:hypothetical protein
LDRIAGGLPPALEIAVGAPVALDLARQRLDQQRMFAEALEDRQQRVARSADAEGAPEVQRIVIAQPGSGPALAAGQRIAGCHDLPVPPDTAAC